jgi:glycosyltransferase involved in cell wall biosynthesis
VVNKIIYSGPKLFLNRLENSISDMPCNIVNPDISSIKKVKSLDDNILIGRLDGAYYYDFTPRNLYYFFEQRSIPYYQKLKFLTKAPPMSSHTLNKIFNAYLNRASTWLLNNSDGIVFQSELSKSMHLKFIGFDESKIKSVVINNGVNLNEFYPKRCDKKLKGEPALIISASRFRLNKRLHEAVKLVNYLSSSLKGVHLHVLGEINNMVERSLSGICTDRVTFYGKVSPDKLVDYYSSADIMLSVSMFDPCPNVVVEGLACGLPVVTPKESGAAELVGQDLWTINDGMQLKYYELQTIEAIPSIDLVMYKDTILRIFNNLGENKEIARARAVEKLDINSISDKYMNFYQELIK